MNFKVSLYKRGVKVIFTKRSSGRERIGAAAGVFGIITNLIAFIIKLVAGTLSGSVTVAADAVNSLTDAGSSILTLIGFRLSAKPADREHPYGHARYEQITALIISLLMIAVGVVFAKSSIEKIISPSKLSFGAATYFALLAAIILKLAQGLVNRYLAKKIDSTALRAAAQDSFNDALITSTVLIGVLVMAVYEINIDGWAGLFVSLFVIRSSALTLKSAISPMLGSSPPDELVNSVAEIVRSRPEILGFHDLVIHNYGVGKNYGSVHVEVDGDRKIRDIHEVVDGIEKEIGLKLGVVITIHTDPVSVEEKNTEGVDEKD